MERVGRGQCGGLEIRSRKIGGDAMREGGDEDKYVKGRRWDGRSRITKKKGEKRRRGRGLHYGYCAVLIS